MSPLCEHLADAERFRHGRERRRDQQIDARLDEHSHLRLVEGSRRIRGECGRGVERIMCRSDHTRDEHLHVGHPVPDGLQQPDTTLVDAAGSVGGRPAARHRSGVARDVGAYTTMGSPNSRAIVA